MSDTLAAPASHAIEVKHSRFLAQAAPVQTSAQALAFLEEIARTPATHHCWAWRIGGDYRSSDDGEPAGTAGRPILAAIDGQGFDRVMVVVTRWYGGVKLGAGGLVRAYGGADGYARTISEAFEAWDGMWRDLGRSHLAPTGVLCVSQKVGDEADTPVTLYGQEKDAATSGLARMNMILHNNPTALIVQGNTLADPKFKDGGTLKTFDYVVANPPFSDKRWSNGVDALNDSYDRFKPFGVPPAKQGDYAYLLHIVRSLKSIGKGACILPHGVLFRGNAEADIRRALVRKGYIKSIIGLPPNLFYGMSELQFESAVPEPSTAAILLLGVGGAIARRRTM